MSTPQVRLNSNLWGVFILCETQYKFLKVLVGYPHVHTYAVFLREPRADTTLCKIMPKITSNIPIIDTELGNGALKKSISPSKANTTSPDCVASTPASLWSSP